MSDQIYDKVDADQDPFRRILSKIPGFSGYIESQKRRSSDKLLREPVANRFEQIYQKISSLQRELVNAGEIGYLDNLEAAAIKIRTFADRIRRATRGYSGVFDAVKIKEEELGLLYQYDAQILDLVDEVNHAVDNVELSIGSDGLPASIRHLTKVSQDCIDVYDRREEVILGGEISQ